MPRLPSEAFRHFATARALNSLVVTHITCDWGGRLSPDCGLLPGARLFYRLWGEILRNYMQCTLGVLCICGTLTFVCAGFVT